MRGFLLARIAGMCGEGMIQHLAIDILHMLGKMVPYRTRQVGIVSIWHVGSRYMACGITLRESATPAWSKYG
jgi:hypothetical protein